MDVRAIALIALVLACTPDVQAFDTGHHWDMTRNALLNFNFSSDTIQIMQVINWMTDFYSFGSLAAKITDLQLLHTDTIRNTNETICYWRQLQVGMKQGVQTYTNNKDVWGLVGLLAFSLHTVQDFYTHSSWVERHPRSETCGCFRTDTYFSYAQNVSNLPDIFCDACDFCERVEPRIKPGMVDHGGYCYGINKDSIVRPNFEEAFVYAFIGSVEWITQVKKWSMAIDPDIWDQVITYNGVSATHDWTAGFHLSAWLLTGADNDGHWKGSGSGNGLKGLLKYIGWSLTPDSHLIKNVKNSKMYEYLTQPSPYSVCDALQNPNDTMVEPISSNFTNNLYAVIFRTTDIFKTAYLDLENLVTRNYTDTQASTFALYAQITIGDQTYVEPTQRDILHPYWTSMKIIHADMLEGWPEDPTISISFGLFQENTWNADVQLDINLNVTENSAFGLNMKYHLFSHRLEGDVNGTFDNYDTTYMAVGDISYARFYVTTLAFSNCSQAIYNGNVSDQNPPQCNDTAFAQLGFPYICTTKGAKAATHVFAASIAAIVLPIGYFVLAGIIGTVLWCLSKRRDRKRRAYGRHAINSFERDSLLREATS